MTAAAAKSDQIITDSKKKIMKNMMTRFTKISLSGVSLDQVIGKTNLFIEVSIATLNYRCFTAICENQYKLDWDVIAPIIHVNHAANSDNVVSFKLYDVRDHKSDLTDATSTT